MKKTIAMLLALALLLAFVGCQKETETLPITTAPQQTTQTKPQQTEPKPTTPILIPINQFLHS